MIRTASRVLGRFEGWLTSPVPGAAENLGLFRILYGLFYLWHLSWVYMSDLVAVPDAAWKPVMVFVVLGRPPGGLMVLAVAVLMVLLILLAIGFKTRQVTYAVLFIGAFVDGYHQSMGKMEHATVFLTFFIPLFMTQAGWGDRYSVDAFRRTGSFSGHPQTAENRVDEGGYAWPPRVILIILSFLFLSGAWAKAVNGSWLEDASVIHNVTLFGGRMAGFYGVSTPPVHLLISSVPVLGVAAAIAILLFEGLFFLSLFSTRVRSVFLGLAILFHSANALVLAVTFAPIAIVYGLFVDWEGWVDWARASRLGSTPRRMKALGAVLIAATAAVILTGILNWRTFWIAFLVVWALAILSRRDSRPTGPRSAPALGSAPT